jgi:Ca-activated chloride channel family protein
MNREKAEKLLAALIFDDLDEASKADLLTFLQTDDELRERLADMRMAVKVASDTLQQGPEPVLSKRRLKHLAKLAARQKARPRIFTLPRLVAAAAVLVAVLLPAILILTPPLGVKRELSWAKVATPAAQLQSDTRNSHFRGGAAGQSLPYAEELSGGDRASGRYAYTPDDPALKYSVRSGGARAPIATDGHSLKIAKADEGVRGQVLGIGGYGAAGREARLGHDDYAVASSASRPSSATKPDGSIVTEIYGRTVNGTLGEGVSPTLPPDNTVALYYNYPGTGTDLDKSLRIEQGGSASVVNGDAVTFKDGDLHSTWEKAEVATSPRGSEPRKPSQPVGGSKPSYVPHAGLQPVEKLGQTVTMDAESEELLEEARRHPRAEENYAYLDRWNVEADAKTEMADRKKAKLSASGYKTMAERGRGEVSRQEQRPLGGPAKKKSETASGIYYDRFALAEAIKPPRDAGRRGGRDESSSSTERVEHDRSTREPMLADTPALGRVVDRTESKQRASEQQAQRKLEGLIDEMLAAKEAKAPLSQAKSQPEPATPVTGPRHEEHRERTEMAGDVLGTRRTSDRQEQAGLASTSDARAIDGRRQKDSGAVVSEPPAPTFTGAPSVPSITTPPVTGAGSLPARELDSLKNELLSDDRAGVLSEEDVSSPLRGELPAAARFRLLPVNPWVMTDRDSLSTFGLDVDTASYTLCRRYIRGGFLPPPGAVRIEEFINYFNYNYPQRPNPPFTVYARAAPSPFARKGQDLTLLKIGVKARTIGRDQRRTAHLIFVVDASASMGQPERLPVIQKTLMLLMDKLSPVDRVSLISFANEARLHLEATSARQRDKIREVIDAIQPAGPTNLLAGLKLGYATARRTFDPKRINHVVLCSDGIANVGQTQAEAVLNEVAADRKQGITTTCVGVGYGSYNDAFLEPLANRGDGSYVFLDSAEQTRRAFAEKFAATVQTVARNARIQVEFNPKRVRRYRLIGYENRDIEDKRFRDDTVDAGEVGSGQCSTALYELELIGRPSSARGADIGTVFVRYRNAESDRIEEISSRLSSAVVQRLTVESAPRFFLAAGAARFAEILRESEHAQRTNLMDVLRVVEQASLALPLDHDVRELVDLVRKSENLPKVP